MLTDPSNTAGGVCFSNTCDQSATYAGYTSSSTLTVDTLQDCVNACDQDQACNTYDFDGHTGLCSLFDNTQTDAAVSNPGDAFGVYDPSCS